MRPVDALDPFLGQHLVEQAAGAAVPIKNENRPIMALSGSNDLADPFGNARGRVVPDCRQALDIEGGPAIGFDQRHDLAGQGAAGNQQHAAFAAGEDEVLARHELRQWGVLVDHVIHMGWRLRARHLCRRQALAASRLWRRAISSLAVSTATAASRQ